HGRSSIALAMGSGPSSWRKAWFLAHASLGPITIGLASVALVLGAVLIRDKYVGETDSGVLE
ncbi:hypothetical protein, partial [Klebsiella pneumoniae]|uniref:hypothetical protein n=1 Tax=Klebsiella pneumoniae TaxID=573 RepID=UPI001954B727